VGARARARALQAGRRPRAPAQVLVILRGLVEVDHLVALDVVSEDDLRVELAGGIKVPADAVVRELCGAHGRG
jgi:hypothetical protein